MTELEAKARQLARVNGASDGSYDVCKEAIALEMSEWMTAKTIEWLVQHFKTNSFGETQSYDFKSMKDMVDNFKKYTEQ